VRKLSSKVIFRCFACLKTGEVASKAVYFIIKLDDELSPKEEDYVSNF